MAVVLKYIDDFHTLMNKHSDFRTTNWFLMSSPLYTLGISLSYVYLVKVWGPKYMENRKPFQLKNVIIGYNLFQVILSAWLFYEIGMSGWLTGHYNFRCQPVDYSDHPAATRMAHASWWYFMSKFTELFDTVFFVMRKKFSQVTNLHVIHHGIMPISVWFGVKFIPGGHGSFFGILNTFVHIIMYFYYFLAAIGPQMRKYTWWKKYLTALQIIQFMTIMVHSFQLLFIDCDYPRGFMWFIGMHTILFFFLFKNFYNQAYSQGGTRKVLASGKEHERHSDNQNLNTNQSKHTSKQNRTNSVNSHLNRTKVE